MPYRSTKEKAENRIMARLLYTEEGLSLEEVSQSTGETVKTIRAWRNIGQWDQMKLGAYAAESDRLQALRTSLYDRIEAQFKENKLPHTEIGLLAKVDRMITRQEARDALDPGRVVLTMTDWLLSELTEHDRDLLQAMIPYFEKLGVQLRKHGLGGMVKRGKDDGRI